MIFLFDPGCCGKDMDCKVKRLEERIEKLLAANHVMNSSMETMTKIIHTMNSSMEKMTDLKNNINATSTIGDLTKN